MFDYVKINECFLKMWTYRRYLRPYFSMMMMMMHGTRWCL